MNDALNLATYPPMSDQTYSIVTTTDRPSPPPTTTPHPPPPPTPLIPHLPDDISIQCIARVPRTHHPTLSLVSKLWHSTIRSQHFFTTRSLLHITQPSLYLNIRHNSTFQYYFHANPNNPNHKLSPFPHPPVPIHPVGPAYAVLGSKIYLIGGSVNDIPLNTVWVLDCKINKWEVGPRMRVGREFAAAATVGGKIYVMGGCVVDNRLKAVNWAEVYDPEVGEWGPVGSLEVEGKDKWMHACAVIDGRIYAMADRGGVVYDVVGREWGRVPKRLDLGGGGGGGVGGKVMDVMCAEIDVRKDEDGGLSGSVLWVDVILSVPVGSSILHCMAVALILNNSPQAYKSTGNRRIGIVHNLFVSFWL
ncbi:putative F-box domain, kelch-type beta propeller, F-box-like domain superfamily [Helianthus annuus]|nr:putative F-box domain, kelch-type beta propeller, F-box-like domain superfamily [Helianthus annuus]KAJ0473738.1 putative F-box domain, kelch-type beta propeller, F-box-like domain superfamily [Helianthus annuus]KAJ0649313.1 putative F-box domain, kelch-type beta propeller, F-box-like domain superfamily [Helianthus annuus]